jgi:catecholate siderophore receptor
MLSRTTLFANPPSGSLALAAAGVSLATSAYATDGPLQLPPLEVEGRAAVAEPEQRTFTAPLINTPQTVSVIPQEVFVRQGAQNLTDVLRNTPGITFNAGENAFTSGLSNFSMRGFDATGSVFIDGARDSGNYSRDVFNLEQVEVVKGPAADNGRGGAGGYVNLVTKTPFNFRSISGAASVGLDGYDSETRYRATADINHPFTETTAARLNLLWQTGGIPGREVTEKTAWGVAPSLAFGLGQPTQVFLSYQHAEQDDLPDWGVPAAIIEGMLRFDPALDGEQLRDSFYGISSDNDDIRSDALLGRIAHTFASGMTISNQTRRSDTERQTVYTLISSYTPATQLVATQRQANARENTAISNLTNLRYSFMTGSLRHTFSGGIDYSHETSKAKRFPAQTNPGGAPISIFDPDPDRAGAPNFVATQTSEVSVQTFAGYAYDTVEFSPQWQLTGGVRVESYSVEIDSTTVAGAPISGDDYEVDRTTVGGKVGIVFKPVEQGTIYGAVGLSSLPPGSFLSNPDISREGDNAFPGFATGLNSEGAKVQRSVNYEAGVKWSFFDSFLHTNAAVFRTVRKNVAITGRDPRVTPLPPVALLGYGEQIVQGLELTVTGYLTDAWHVFGGMAIMETERSHSELLDEARQLANPADYGAETRTNGDELAFAPNFTANLWTTYRFPFGLTVGGGVQHSGASWVGRPDDAERIIANGVAGELPGYTVFSAMAEYQATPNILVRLNIDNVTDELYAVSTNWPAQRVLLGPPRTFLLSASVTF